MDSERPRVSIITPTLNSVAFLREHLDSVDAQTYPSIEHVLVDGGSTDGTVDLIKEYAATHNVKWVSEPDGGTSEAVNKGLRMTCGDILVILPSDDLMFPWSVATAVEYLHAHPETDIASGDSLAWNDDDVWHFRLHKPFTHGFMARTQTLAAQATYFRRQVLDDVGGMDTAYTYANDVDFWIRATDGRNVRTVREVLALYRKRPGALCRLEGAPEAVEREVAEIRARCLNTESPFYGLMRWWDRVSSAVYKRFLLLRMLYGSARVDRKRASRPKPGPWRHFLNEFEVSLESRRRLFTTLLPKRRTYGTHIRLRPDSAWRHLPWMNPPAATR